MDGDDGAWGAEADTELNLEARARWEVPELIAATAAAASVGLFVCFVLGGIDLAVRARQVAPTFAVPATTQWAAFTVPLMLLAALTAWCGERDLVTGNPDEVDATLRRFRPSPLVVAVLGPLAAAAGVARTVDTPVNFSAGGSVRVANTAQSAGFCVMAVAAGLAQWLAARRLLRPGRSAR